MNDRNTPRADEARDRCRQCGLEFVAAEEMEKLERELVELASVSQWLLIVSEAPHPDEVGIDAARHHLRAAIAKAQSK